MSEASKLRLTKLLSHLKPEQVSSEQVDYVNNYRKKLRECREELYSFIDKQNCNPILVRLAWHDSGTFDRTIKQYPNCGGANGSIRFNKELSHAANAGLSKAVNYLQTFKNKYPEISWADLIQLASVTAIHHSGGPLIPIKFGRIDIKNDNECPKEGNLPSANPPFPDNVDAATHLRRIFYRMGFNDQEIVVLSGAHTLGRAFRERSGTVNEGYGDKNATEFTKNPSLPRYDKKKGLGMSGGRSWTENWLSFNNEYYNFDELSEEKQKKLLQLTTDKILFVDETFKQYTKIYKENPELFFRDYIDAHIKLSQLGSVFNPSQGFYL